MTITIVRDHDPEATRRILAALPDWFGIPEANEHYVQAAAEKDSYLARVGDATVGVALVDRHFPETAEIHLIAVAPGHHGSGVGSALVEALEADVRRDGARLLEVKTVGSSFEDEGYAATRAFYQARGFLPLEEVSALDWDGPTLIMVKAL
ncbi:GNAT family N-acetyltransferase [Ornithinimicrobium cryptoxanthini]|uniref:GNAT family N-acetyltransferase n=1 Tax=Ornithinimicrobium cryptoxanthini TaxID=2934161 RepID=A0ABY4YK84_9MICO|nr:GNAT family N-acetyltransferase [Ornithinimicrobium cryptoxanthini]USQ77216.1 GNAT family N-acetyltransferase [Ornithinimicrobium cryptoxanthini]